MTSPPREREALRKWVDAYNQRTLTDAELYAHGKVSRWFYERSWSLNPDYREISGFAGTSIDDFHSSLLFAVHFDGSRRQGRYGFFVNGQQAAYRYFGDTDWTDLD